MNFIQILIQPKIKLELQYLNCLTYFKKNNSIIYNAYSSTLKRDTISFPKVIIRCKLFHMYCYLYTQFNNMARLVFIYNLHVFLLKLTKIFNAMIP